MVGQELKHEPGEVTWASEDNLYSARPARWFRVIRDGSGGVDEYPGSQTAAMPVFGDRLTREQIRLAIT